MAVLRLLGTFREWGTQKAVEPHRASQIANNDAHGVEPSLSHLQRIGYSVNVPEREVREAYWATAASIEPWCILRCPISTRSSRCATDIGPTGVSRC